LQHKNKTLLFLPVLLLALIATCARGAEIKVVIDSKPVDLTSPPSIQNGVLFVPVSVLKHMGADAKPRGNSRGNIQQIEITTAEKARIYADARKTGSQLMIPAMEVLPKMGAIAAWDNLTDTLSIRAKLTGIEFNGSEFIVNTSYPVTYNVAWWKSANRLIIDIKGSQMRYQNWECPIKSTGVRIRTGTHDSGETTRIVMDMPGPTEYRIKSESKTNEIRIAMGQNLPAEAPKTPVITRNPNPVETISQAPPVETIEPETPPADITDITVKPVNSRTTDIIITADRRVDSDQIETFMLRKPERLVLDIPNANIAKQLSTINVNSGVLKSIRTAPKDDGSVRIVLDLERITGYSIDNESGANRLIMRLELPKNAGGKLSQKIIVIDPGHGGAQPGAIGLSGEPEKNYTLAIATQVQKAFANAGACAFLTRKSDITLGLGERVQIAKRHLADFFVSIHINSCQIKGALSGLETFYHGKETSGRLLANCVQTEVAGMVDLVDRGVKSDYRIAPNAGFKVLRDSAASDIPAILVEVGFINHPDDAANLQDTSFQQKVAESIVRGVKLYVEGSK
jgi:N-acetylmuramoyl-L-alanine amidase